MANKLLTVAGLKAAVAKSEVKDFLESNVSKDLVKDLENLEVHDENDKEQFTLRRSWLNEVIEDVPATKSLAKADKAVVKYLDDVLRAATTERKKIDTYLEKFGMRKIKLVLHMINWDGKAMKDRYVQVRFRDPPAPWIYLTKKDVRDGYVEFNPVELPPTGSIIVYAMSSRGSSQFAEGMREYVLPKKSAVVFRVEEQSEDTKKKEKSAKKAAEKAGVKGTAGINFHIFTAQGEITSEKELTLEHEEEKEFAIKYPNGVLKIGDPK